MPITPQQREERKAWLGSSDIAAIMGLDPFKSSYDVWLEKTGKLVDAPQPDDPNDPRNVGNRLENAVLDFAEERLGVLQRNAQAAIIGTPIRVNTDAIVLATGIPVEAKTTADGEFWGDDGVPNQAPDRVIIQSHCHMLAWNQDVCYVPCLEAHFRFKFTMRPITMDSRIADAIRERATMFWAHNVAGDIPPENSTASLEVVKLIRRTPEKVTTVDPELVSRWLESKQIAAEAAKRAEADQAAMVAAMGDGEAATCGELGAVTYYEQKRKGFTVAESSYRVLRHKKSGL